MSTLIKCGNSTDQLKLTSPLKVASSDNAQDPPPLHQLSPIPISHFAQQVTPYKPVSSQRKILQQTSSERPFKLDWNEATISPSPKVAEAIRLYLQGSNGLNWYPELESQSLLHKLTSYTGLDPDYLIATSGSDDALSLLCTCFVNPGDAVVVPVPTYNHFVVFAQAHGADVREVLPIDPFQANIEGIYNAIQHDTRIVYLISPNNPTGSLVPTEQVEVLCRSYPNTLFILDEAYFEFAQVSGIHLVKHFKNLIVTRTFSKAFGLAGLRVGYLAAHPSLLEGIKRLYNPKSVNSLAQVGAAAALDDIPYLDAFLEEVNQSKAIYKAFFDTCPHFEATITPANFIVLKVEDPQATIQALESRHIYVRDRSNYPGMTNCLRMSVGSVEQTKEVVERLADLFA